MKSLANRLNEQIVCLQVNIDDHYFHQHLGHLLGGHFILHRLKIFDCLDDGLTAESLWETVYC
jgi:hypothetical protein